MSNEETRSGWDYAQLGEFSKAYAALTLDIEKEYTRALHYMNRGIVLLNLFRLLEAEQDFRSYIDLSPDSSAGYIKLGLSQWLQNEKSLAIATWRLALTARFSDEAGGVEAPSLLYYSALTTNNNADLEQARDLLRRRWRASLAKIWPGPIIAYLLGEMDEETFLIRQTFLNPDLESRRLCRANFWIAVQRLSIGDEENCKGFWKKCAAVRQLLETEYYLANHELKRLQLG
jgi:lipoprotein NlpI